MKKSPSVFASTIIISPKRKRKNENEKKREKERTKNEINKTNMNEQK